MNPLTTREIFEQVRELRPRMEAAIQAEAATAADLPRLRLERDHRKAELERAEANAFLMAKARKATDATAQRMAKLDPAVIEAEQAYAQAVELVRSKVDEQNLKHSETKAWGGLVETNGALSWALQKEIKMLGGMPS